MKRLLLLVALLSPAVAHGQAYRIGQGAQMQCRSDAPTAAPDRAILWCKSTDSDKLYYTTPGGTSGAVAGSGGGTFAADYSSTSTDNRVSVASAGGPVDFKPGSSSQGAVLQAHTSAGTLLCSVADNAAATLYGNAADSGTNVGTHIGAATALTSSRAYMSIDNGGTSQWTAYTTAGGVRTLECVAGSSAQVIGNGGLSLQANNTSTAAIGIDGTQAIALMSAQTAANGAAYTFDTSNALGSTDPIFETMNHGSDVFVLLGDGSITSTKISGANNTITGIGIAALSATGTPSSSTYLRGDNTWATASGGGGGTFATTYSTTPADNLVAEGSSGGELILKYDAIGTANTKGFTVENTTAALVGAQQYGPLICDLGKTWETTGPSSQTAGYCWRAEGTNGATATSRMSIYNNTNGTLTEAFRMKFNAAGTQGSFAAGAGGTTTAIFSPNENSAILVTSSQLDFAQGGTDITLSTLDWHPSADNSYTDGDATHNWKGVFGAWFSTKEGTQITAASSITPTLGLQQITGGTSVGTIVATNVQGNGTATLCATSGSGAVTWTTGGNIAGAGGTIADGTCKGFRYIVSATTWYPQ